MPETDGDRYLHELWRAVEEQRGREPLSRTEQLALREAEDSRLREALSQRLPEGSPDELEQVWNRFSQVMYSCSHGFGCSCAIWRLIAAEMAGAEELLTQHGITIGSLPTGDINAIVFIDDDIRLMLFDDGLCHFAHLLGMAIAAVVPYHTAEEGGPGFAFHPTAVRGNLIGQSDSLNPMFDLFISTIFEGEPSRAQTYIAPESIMGIARGLTGAMEVFAFAHELMHLKHGHIDNAPRQRLALEATGTHVDRISWDWEKEHSADLHALLEVLAHFGYKNWEKSVSQKAVAAKIILAYMGVEAYFHGMMLIHNAVEFMRNGNPRPQLVEGESTSHPPASRRIEVLRAEFEQLQDHPMFSGADLIGGGLCMQAIFEEVWVHLTPLLAKARELGWEVHPRWGACCSDGRPVPGDRECGEHER